MKLEWVVIGGWQLNLLDAIQSKTSGQRSPLLTEEMQCQAWQKSCWMKPQLSWFKSVIIYHLILKLKSVWPSDLIRWHRSGLTFAQVMAQCLVAPNHYRNHCWLTINNVLCHSTEIKQGLIKSVLAKVQFRGPALFKNKANMRDLIVATSLVILLKLDSNRRLFSPCDFEIWWMTPKNNRAPLLCYFKLFASFRSHWWIQSGVTVRKRPVWVKLDDFF